ncbi:MAG: purine-nucleoside phosphorylase [Gemmatimonadota bacterium]
MSDPGPGQERLDQAVQRIRRDWTGAPELGLVLGTGLGGVAAAIDVDVEIPYGEIPGFPVSTVETHAGRLVLGSLEGRTVAGLDGRFHRYEGYELAQIGFPIRVLRALGAETLVVTAACGGMNPLWNPGDLVLLSDHINLMGDSPLIGPNFDSQGPRFPDMSEAYDRELRRVAREEALRLGLLLREGVYVAVTGPNLETAAEYRMLRAIGADIVGMSTVPEVIVARHAGMRVLGLAIITDACLPDALEPASVEEIIATARAAEPDLARLVKAVVAAGGAATGDATSAAG